MSGKGPTLKSLKRELESLKKRQERTEGKVADLKALRKALEGLIENSSE